MGNLSDRFAEDGAPGADGADGTNGVDGKTVLNGTVDPTTEGVDGDFYINTTSNEIFGPKTGGAWGTGTSLVGPAGQNGDNGTVLTTRDMTNSGANDLNNIDITWQASWDTYDYVEIRVTRCRMNNAGLMAFALSPDGGATWKSLYNKTKSAVFWTDTPTIVLTTETRSFTVRINLQEDNKMLHFYDMVASRYTTDEVNLGDNVTVQGFEFDYSGTTLTGSIGILTSAGWQTNSLGLDGYMLRFTHEVGNFVNGTLKIIGYNYP